MTVIQQLNKILQGLLTNPIVAEYDTTDGWHVVKYANGRCTATKSTSLIAGSQGTLTGNVYHLNLRIDLPQGLFQEVNGSNVSTTWGNGVWAGPFVNFSTHIFVTFFRGSQFDASWSMPTYVEVKGSWK